MSKPMEYRPIDRAKLTYLLRQVEIDLVSLKQNCYDYDMSKDIKWAMENLTDAIQMVDKDEQVQESIQTKQKQYPFNDGDTYYTLENNIWVESCWDCVSEEMHDENPNKKYYKAMNLESEVQDA